MSDVHTENPVEQGPKPPFPEQEQPHPGLESAMEPRPDYGERATAASGACRAGPR